MTARVSGEEEEEAAEEEEQQQAVALLPIPAVFFGTSDQRAAGWRDTFHSSQYRADLMETGNFKGTVHLRLSINTERAPEAPETLKLWEDSKSTPQDTRKRNTGFVQSETWDWKVSPELSHK